VVKGESGVQSHSDLDGVGSIPAIPNARYVPSLLCHERFNEASLPVIGIFVDDLSVTCNSIEEITEVRETMNERFVLIDQGPLEYYQGVEATKPDENTIMLHQTGYRHKVLERFKMTDSHPANTPLPSCCKLSLMDSPEEVDTFSCNTNIGQS
jgi:hypothetical protein